MVSINVLIITYNQQDVIGRAIDSVLQQREWGLKEIIICDDNSKDKNWDVIQDYAKRYPQIIRAYRNEPNLGIIRNIEHTYQLAGDADLYVSLAGDDAFNDGYFKTVQELVRTKHIDTRKEASILCFAFESVKPNGKRRLMSNSNISRSSQLFRLKYRNMVSGRGMLWTKSVMDKYKKVEDVSNLVEAEELCEIQPFLNADTAYYSPFVANRYYARIGVSTRMHQNDFYQKYIEKFENFLKIFELEKKDVYFTQMKIYQYAYYIKPTFKGLFNIVRYYIKSFDFSLGINSTQFLISIRDIVKTTLRLNI